MTSEQIYAGPVIAVIGTVLTLVAGHWFLKWMFNRASGLKDEIAAIARSLIFYANRRYSGLPDEKDETRRVFREHAASLQRYANVILLYGLWRRLLSLPERDALFLASHELIGHSNVGDAPSGYDSAKEIRRLLGIETTCDVMKRRTEQAAQLRS